jgi:hypothetical protein
MQRRVIADASPGRFPQGLPYEAPPQRLVSFACNDTKVADHGIVESPREAVALALE